MIKGRYALEDVLDHVRIGTLYRAVDTEHSYDGRIRYVSLWVLPPQTVTQPAALSALQQDFLEIRQLAHPNIARVFELDRDGETAFVTGEFVDGETLRTVLSHLRPERLSLAEADAIVTAVGTALEHAHERGIVHGEVRAENILVTLDRDFKLANFVTTSAMRAGPFAARPADDVRDLAALAYELYLGEPAPQEPPARIRAKGLPRARARAIAAALATRRRRITSVRAFLDSAGLSAEAPAEAHVRPRVAVQRRAAPRRIPQARTSTGRWPLALGVLGVAAIGAGLFAVSGNAWLAGAQIEQIDDWSKQVFQRFAAGMPALRTPSPERTARPRPAAPAETAPADTPPPGAQSAPAESAAPEALAADTHPTGGDALEEREAPQQPVEAPEATVRPIAGLMPVPPAEKPAAARLPAPEADPLIEFASSNVVAREGRPVVSVEIVRTGATSATAEIVWWTSDGTARSPDDYANFGRRVERFAPGETHRVIHIPIASDSLPEPDEHFVVHLDRRARGAEIGARASLQVTIVDDDL